MVGPSPHPVTQWERDVRFVEGLYSQLETWLTLFVWCSDNSLHLLTDLAAALGK